MQKVDSVAFIQDVEIMPGRRIPGDVIACWTALVHLLELSQFELVVGGGDRRDIGTVGQAGKVVGAERQVTRGANDDARARQSAGGAVSGTESLR